MVSDHPDAYDGEPAFNFIKACPATWAETRVLEGLPAKFVTIARRHGNEWFLGSMANWDTRCRSSPEFPQCWELSRGDLR